MKKILAGALALLALASCNEQGSTDGYYFEPVPRLEERRIIVKTHPSLEALKSEFSKYPSAPNISRDRALQAFSVISSTTCTVHIVDPAVRYMPEFIGHEIVHCLYGEFHPSQH
jgi:hypothetical protein